MANLLKLTVRGTLVTSQWAINLWYRKESPPGILDEAAQASVLANAFYLQWVDLVLPALSGNVITNKVIVEGYDTPECFYELPVSGIGVLVGQICPPFVAMGVRQFRTNSDFRVATHRLPGVREVNNADGSFVYTEELDTEKIADMASLFALPLTGSEDSITYDYQPVLIRTQYTPRGVPDPITVIYDPPEVSDIPSAGFYGITSQVTRKRIVPS